MRMEPVSGASGFNGRNGERYIVGVEVDMPPADVGLAFAHGWRQVPVGPDGTALTPSEVLARIVALEARVSALDGKSVSGTGSNVPAAPSFSPGTGTYSAPQTVTISGSGVIHFTTDGSTPTAVSPVYTSPIQVTSTQTINAIAVTAGQPDSAVDSATYTIGPVPVNIPTIKTAPVSNPIITGVKV